MTTGTVDALLARMDNANRAKAEALLDHMEKMLSVLRDNGTVSLMLAYKDLTDIALACDPRRPKTDRDRTAYDAIDRVLMEWPPDQPLPPILYYWLHAHYRNPSKPRKRKVPQFTYRDTIITDTVNNIGKECDDIPLVTYNRQSGDPITACHLVAARLDWPYETVRDIWKKNHKKVNNAKGQIYGGTGPNAAGPQAES